MNTQNLDGQARGRRSLSRRIQGLLLGPMLVGNAACSFMGADASQPAPPSSPPQIVYRVSERSFAEASVTLLPQPIHTTADFGEDDGVRLYIGGTGLFRSGDHADPYNRLALVILAARDQIDPVLRENHQLLLDIDGEMFRTLPMRDPRMYSFGRTGFGYTETVIVPIDLDLLTRLAQARSVRGRIGHWLAFEMSPEMLSRLDDLRSALPSDFPTGRQGRPPIRSWQITYQ